MRTLQLQTNHYRSGSALCIQRQVLRRPVSLVGRPSQIPSSELNPRVISRSGLLSKRKKIRSTHRNTLTLDRMRLPGHKFSLVEANKAPKERTAKQQDGGVRLIETPESIRNLTKTEPVSQKVARGDGDSELNEHRFLAQTKDPSDSDQACLHFKCTYIN